MNEGALLVWIPVGLCLVFIIWFIGTYNSLVRLRNYCQEAWGQIETELKRRYDLIPNLVSTVKGYAAHERDVFEPQ
jgi:LemA protein